MLQTQAAQRQAATLREALDSREPVDRLETLASQLRQMLVGIESDETRSGFDAILEEVRARQLAREQVSAELQELRKAPKILLTLSRGRGLKRACRKLRRSFLVKEGFRTPAKKLPGLWMRVEKNTSGSLPS